MWYKHVLPFWTPGAGHAATLSWLPRPIVYDPHITGIETAALKLGATMATHGVKSWLRRRQVSFERGASLAQLAEAALKSPLQRRKLDNFIERIGQQVAEQLAPILAQKFGSLPTNDIDSAIFAVVDVLSEAGLSDRALLAIDSDPEQLARRLREQFPGRPRKLLLSLRAYPLYELALDQACRHLIQVIRYLPSFPTVALPEVLTRLTSQSEQLERIPARTPTTSLYAPRGIDYDQEFRTKYLDNLTNSLDHLELLGLPMDEQPTLTLTVAYLRACLRSMWW